MIDITTRENALDIVLKRDVNEFRKLSRGETMEFSGGGVTDSSSVNPSLLEVSPLAAEEEFLTQHTVSEPDECARAHLAAVESDIAALVSTVGKIDPHSKEEIGLDDRTHQEIKQSKAVILELLPKSKRERVAAAIEAGILSAQPALGGHRTVAREHKRLFSFFLPGVSLKDILINNR